jgi:hypothetical protein
VPRPEFEEYEPLLQYDPAFAATGTIIARVKLIKVTVIKRFKLDSPIS